MKRKTKYCMCLSLVFLVFCGVNSPDDINESSDSPVIVYTSVGEWYSKIHIIQNDKNMTLFESDTIKRSYVCFNEKKKMISYMRNLAIYPMVGPVGDPSVYVSEMNGTNEKEILSYDASQKYFYPDWISDSEIALFKQTIDKKTYLTIVTDDNSQLIKEIPLSYDGDIYGCFSFNATDTILCLLCCAENNSSIGILNKMEKVLLNEIDVNTLDYWAPIKKPLLGENKIYFLISTSPYQYKVYDISSNTFSNYSFPIDSIEIIYRTDDEYIVYDDSPRKLKVYDKSFSLISEIIIGDHYLEGTLPFFKNKQLYFISECLDDAFVIVKADFLKSSVADISDVIEDNFILDAKIY